MVIAPPENWSSEGFCVFRSQRKDSVADIMPLSHTKVTDEKGRLLKQV